MARHFLLPSLRAAQYYQKNLPMMNRLLTLDYHRFFFLDFWILG